MKNYLIQLTGGTAFSCIAIFLILFLSAWYGNLTFQGGYEGFGTAKMAFAVCTLIYALLNSVYILLEYKQLAQKLCGVFVMTASAIIGVLLVYSILKLVVWLA